MRALKLIFAISIIFSSCLAQAKEIKNQTEARDLTKKFMSLVSLGQIDAAFAEVKDLVVIPQAELEVLSQKIKSQMPLYLSRYGKSVGSEFISEAKTGDSLYKVVYIQKFDKHIIRWQFIYYKPKAMWILNSFKFDDDISGVF
jgi:hypothetical protein